MLGSLAIPLTFIFSRKGPVQSSSRFSSWRHAVVNRRQMVQAGAVSFLGLGMHQLGALAARQQATSTRSVIFINAVGGISQLDTFDLKPNGPAEIRGEFQPISTSVPGIQICEHLPMLAQRAQLFSLVRSLSHPYTGHQEGLYAMQCGRTPLPRGFTGLVNHNDWPSITAQVNYATRSRGGMPQAVILPELLYNDGLISGQRAAMMPARYDPWVVQASGTQVGEWGACPDCWGEKGVKHDYECRANPAFESPRLEMPENMDERRVGGRIDLLDSIARHRRGLDRADAAVQLSHYRQQLTSLLLDERTQQAFDVRGADDDIQDRYGRNKFGWSLLMARRLVEVGVNMVQVNLGHTGTWDTHWENFTRLKERLLPATDRALAALLDDLNERGMLDDVLVVLASEFGRTPRIFLPPTAKGTEPGRDHWGFAQSVLFAGGGVQGGRVIGKTDKQAAYPASERKTPEDFAATIYRVLGIPATTVWYDELDRPNQIYHGRPIIELF